MTLVNQSPFVVLFQGIIAPQQACHELHIKPIFGFLSGPIEANWWFEAEFHRLAITFIPKSVPKPNEIGTILTQFRAVGFELTTTILRSQALFSGQILSLSSYTVAHKSGGALKPLWVELGDVRESRIPIIASNDIERAARHIAPVAIYSGHRSLQLALGDYERSINAEGKDKLIFLYRAVEEILWHYFLKSNPNSDDRNPSPSSCAKALELGHDPSKREKWISEFTTLAHERGRHSEGRPYTHKLPASLNDCILAAEKRVVTIIERHALDLGGNRQWEPIKKDVLTGWLNPEDKGENFQWL